MTLKPSFEMALLIDRIAKGDLTAIPDLWPLLTDKPFDSKRPLEDIGNDLVELIKPYTPEPEPDKSKSAEELAALLAAAEEVGSVLGRWLAEGAKSKPKRKA